MAARILQRRLISLFERNQPQNPLLSSPSWQFFPSTSAILNRFGFYEREIQTQSNRSSHDGKDLESREASMLKSSSDAEYVSLPTDSEDKSAVKFSANSNLRPSSRHDLAMIFTCKVCETRSVKTVCRESYEKGVVVVRCGGCDNLHLMADNLGWFGKPGSVEDFLAARGEEVKKGSVDTLSLTVDDLAGRKP
ncbi:DNL-type zinc finger protein [Quillaja saponaria]|uniref:DNL-type zinc finger protein n=1 Tax=Quillaja saponaria TaxID=32244 RepID=A0AAD7Q5A4_QUISA|nr:DNL-type zinc finger protein [Quillaja saponaria]